MTFLKDTGLTIIHPFYNDGKERISLQFEAWETYPDWVWDAVDVVLIDDGSDPSLESHYPKDNGLNFNLKIYRIKEDLRYNLPGAWNLGFNAANTDWVYAFDSDHIHTKENFIKVLTELDAQSDCYYQLERRRHTSIEKRKRPGRMATGSWLVLKEYWTAVDGFDEDLTGERSQSWGYWEHDFTDRLNNLVPKVCPPGIFIEEYLPDYFGYPPGLHVGWNNRKNRRRYTAKMRGEIEHPTEILRFDWEQVYEQRRTHV
jgi:glycosyltransferase involved in cell wall biosynthesis